MSLHGAFTVGSAGHGGHTFNSKGRGICELGMSLIYIESYRSVIVTQQDTVLKSKDKGGEWGRGKEKGRKEGKGKAQISVSD